jgi:ankyrin repeat protein
MGNGDIDALGVVDEGAGAQLLHSAAKDGRHQAVQFLIEKGVPIDAAEKFGRTLLYLAVFHRHLEVVSLLLWERIRTSLANAELQKCRKRPRMETLRF